MMQNAIYRRKQYVSMIKNMKEQYKEDLPIDILFKADGVLTADFCHLCGKRWGAPCVDIWYSKNPKQYPEDRANFIRICLRCANAIVAECTKGLMDQLQDTKEGRDMWEVRKQNFQTEDENLDDGRGESSLGHQKEKKDE
jgi:hypothetical protein